MRDEMCAVGAELTVDGLALRQVAVVLASEEVVAVAAHDALDVPGGNVVEHSLRHVCSL